MAIVKNSDRVLIIFTEHEGPLYKAGYSEDGEEIIVYNMTIKAYVLDVKNKIDTTYLHNYPVLGHIKDDQGIYPNYCQKKIINERLDKMIAKGEINLDYWTLVEPEISLKERWSNEAYYEQAISMGHRDIVPEAYEYLKS